MNKVVTGETFKPQARTWNSFIDAAVYVRQRQSDLSVKTPRKDTKSGVVLVRNSTDDDLGQFTVVSLGDLIITPTDNEQDFRNNVPVFELIRDELSDPFGILQRPLKKDEVGSAMLSGVTPVKLNLLSETHEFAELDENGLKSTDSGSVRILWKQSGTGDKWAVILLGASGTWNTYNGYFAASNSSNDTVQQVTVTDGMAVINDTLFEVYSEDIEISASGYVYLQATISGTVLLDPTLEFSTEFPAPASGIFRGLIAVIDWDADNSMIRGVIQQQYGVMYGIIWGACS
jgi:hypothetical protein